MFLEVSKRSVGLQYCLESVYESLRGFIAFREISRSFVGLQQYIGNCTGNLGEVFRGFSSGLRGLHYSLRGFRKCFNALLWISGGFNRREVYGGLNEVVLGV